MGEKASSDPLVRHQKQRKETTLLKAKSAMRAIEADVEEHGTYPHNHGSVNLAELCRGAGIGSATLRNKHHHATRDIVQDWLAPLKRRKPTGRADAYAANREKIAHYDEALRKINAEALEWRADLAAPAEENRRLREQIATVPTGDTAVIGLGGRKGRDA